MTDVVDDLLSKREIVPVAAEPEQVETRTGGLILRCPECGKTANKLGVPFVTNGQLGTHRANVHGYRAPAKAVPAKKTAPAKAVPAKKAAAVKKDPAKATPAPTPTKARKPLGESIARLVLQVGRIINQIEPPTGAVIMFEAGALGNAIDNAIAGTFIDGPLQKASKTASKIEPLVPLISLPAMVFMASRDEKMGQMLEAEIREAIEDVLVQSLPLLKKRATRTRETLEALEELKAIDPEIYGSADPVGTILDGFFAGAPPAEPDAEG